MGNSRPTITGCSAPFFLCQTKLLSGTLYIELARLSCSGRYLVKVSGAHHSR